MDIREDVLRNMRKINLIGMPYQYLFNPINVMIDNLKYGDTQKGPRMKQLPSEKDKNRIDIYLNNNNKWLFLIDKNELNLKLLIFYIKIHKFWSFLFKFKMASCSKFFNIVNFINKNQEVYLK